MTNFNINLCLNDEIKQLTLERKKVKNVAFVSSEINKDIIKNQRTNLAKRRELTLDDLKKIVLTIPFTPALFSKKRTKDNWQSQQIIALDFDDVNYDEVIQKAEHLKEQVEAFGFKFFPNLIYSTMSDNINKPDKRRFRLIYILDEKITDSNIMSNTLNVLNRIIFNGYADVTIGIQSIIFPGSRILFENDVINNSDVCYSLSSEYTQNVKPEINLKNIKTDYLEELDDLINLGKSDKLKETLIKDFEIFEMFFSTEPYYRFHYETVITIFSNLRLLKGGRKIFKEQIKDVIKNGGIDTQYNFQTKSFDSKTYNTHYEPYHLNIKLSDKMQPYSLNSGKFTPFFNDPKNVVVKYFRTNKENKDVKYYNKESVTNFLNSSLNKIVQGGELYIKTETENDEHYIYTSTTQQTDYEYFNTSTEEEENTSYKINLVKLYTGAGKTHTMEQVAYDFIHSKALNISDLFDSKKMLAKIEMEEDKRNLLICFSNHKLKEEFYETYVRRFNDKENIYYTPNYIFKTEELNEYLESLTESNLYNERMVIIKRISENKDIFYKGNQIFYTPDDQYDAKKFLHFNETCKKLENGVILTTHHRGSIDGSLKARSIVFDEDPYSVFSSVREYTPDLRFLKNTDYSDYIIKYVNNEGKEILNLRDEYIYYKKKPLKLSENFVDFCISHKRIDVINFGKSTYYYKRASDLTKPYVYYSNIDLRDINITILSATVNNKVYEMMFPDRKINFFDYSICKIKGSLNNKEYDLEFSNSFFKKVEVKLQDKTLKNIPASQHFSINKAYAQYESLLKEVANKPVITYKKYMHLFPSNLLKDNTLNPDIPYLGNCSGYNTLEGKDIAIVGRMMIPQQIIILEAIGIGINVNDIDVSKNFRSGVETNLATIKHYTFNDPRLQILDIFYTETENTQAIGRARLNRESTGNIDLYSPIYYPIKAE